MKKTLLIILLFSFGISFGQNQADIWYVGDDIKLDFTNGGNPAISKGFDINTGGMMHESSSTQFDANGNLLFGVLGNEIYNGNFDQSNALPPGTWDAKQGSLIFPKPGSQDSYYLSVLRNGGLKNTSPLSFWYTVTPQSDGTIVTSAANDLDSNLTEAQMGVPKISPSDGVSLSFPGLQVLWEWMARAHQGLSFHH